MQHKDRVIAVAGWKELPFVAPDAAHHGHPEELVTHFVSLDVSLEETAICVTDDSGAIVREGKATTEPEANATWLKAAGMTFERAGLGAVAVVVGNAGWRSLRLT